MRRLLALAALLAAVATTAGAQDSTAAVRDSAGIIDPGMTREQVVARLGAPATERTAGGYTYLFYPNGCARACGVDDLVVLHDGVVRDAIFRAPNRRYTGTSSSPSGVRATPTTGARPAPATAPTLAAAPPDTASAPTPASASRGTEPRPPAPQPSDTTTSRP